MYADACDVVVLPAQSPVANNSFNRYMYTTGRYTYPPVSTATLSN